MPVATIDQSFTASPVPFVGGGDADVFTKKGRKTRVRIRVGNLRISGDGRTVFQLSFMKSRNSEKTIHTFPTIRRPSYPSQVAR